MSSAATETVLSPKLAPTTEPYYSVRIPFVDARFATEWHPTENTGPFAVLIRGAFRTEDAAILWAMDHIGGTPYSVIRNDPE